MKKLAILLAVLLLPVGLQAATAEGDPGMYVRFPSAVQSVIAGELWEYEIAPTNFGFIAGNPCPNTDTFCVLVTDELGWTLTGDPAFGTPEILDAGYLWWQLVSVQIPCAVSVGDTNWVSATMYYSDGLTCDPLLSPPDCYESVYSGVLRPQTTRVKFEVVESPPALYILQDSLYFVEQGQTAAYVPFSICNGDACAPPTLYYYVITSTGVVGSAINQTGSITVDGGACLDIYGIIDAGAANVCDYDELTIIAWDELGTVYDTCVQLIHVVTPVPVPLFTAPVVTILVLAMILAAAVIMKRHAVSKA
ncbi:MAG: hypothetical protein PHQ19_06970 [Candidatus Krumholzibacteria bacterium]|nr:hypothetical protein [Candidatus Krumholzibacteria bacterium]